METLAIILIGLAIALIVHWKPFIGIMLAMLFATLGELGRLPESTGLPYLINDLFIPILILIWIIKKISLNRKWTLPPLFAPIAAWITIAAISLLLNSSWLETGELKESALYLVRFIEYFFLYLITADETKAKKPILYGMLASAILIAIFGFIQLKLYPSFYELNMQAEGWDPHINRLLSTWFDPNFVGGFLGFTICIIFGIGLKNYKKIPQKPIETGILATIAGVLLYALYLTYSRSAYLALGFGLLIITGIKSRKLLLAGAVLIAILFITMGKFQSRFLDLWESFQSLIGLNDYATLFNPDATSRLRLDSWQNAITIIKENPFFGVGYNSFRYAQWKAGLIESVDSHSATGSDSTILTIFATTGLLGLMAYIWFYGKALFDSFKASKHSGYALGLTGGLMTLLIHSTFVNSLLFPHILVFLWISLGLLVKISPTTLNS
ncbi:MAG: O-antigen polymerase [uncultured bacterium]|nr:MAG: O-antigen polymerase [uncultured bacterium]OGJ48343.1 MAG: hypothetical protein A2244_02425 [Candidatus Peregrinibacteria bacterium RIFOXYA2_FULL_41_18]OGJ49780.1 MAG: hypothetical protein A2344_03020 [Candidatus Peregrinibacteria bacterium RIFOXYB12_FULL_41_12]OGJ52222.1 MAG: hypothetical protein A2336_01040 [Candidatus Peregrinibacteria bacterium RIFOXYB2_FULL_41_88]